MKDDITPSLIESVNKAFEDNYNSSPTIAKLLKKGKKATYKDAYRYAEQVGNARALAFTEQISSDVLPDGRMYYNIASRLMEDTLGSDQQRIAEYAATAQQNANNRSGLNIKAQKADLNQERIDGFVNRLSSEADFDSVAWILQEPVRTFARTVVDDTVKKNAEFQNKAGVKASIVRTAAAKCCDWCSGIAGTYTYPKVEGKVFARHDYCKCTLDYEGRRLSPYEHNGKAHSFRDQGEQERIDARKNYENQIVHQKTGKMDPRDYAMAVEYWKKLPEYPLSGSEKERIYELFDDNLTFEEKKQPLVNRPFGNNRYYAVHKGHNQYKIYNVEPIEPTTDILDEVMTEMFGSDWRKYDK